MKKLLGPLVLFINIGLSFFLLWQFFFHETFSLPIKLMVVMIALLIIAIISIKSLMILTKKVNHNLNPERKVVVLKKIRKQKRTTTILLAVLAVFLLVGNYIYYLANQTIDTITLNLEPTNLTVHLLVAKDSGIESAMDSKLIHIGFDQGDEQYQSLLEEELQNQYDKYAYIDYQPHLLNIPNLADDLLSEDLHALFVCDSTLEIMNNYNPNFKNQTRIIETYTIETSVAAKNVKVSKEAFNVLILGVDIREDEGDIHSNTRADTIMVASFDPKTMKASLVSIPRDTYTPLSYNNQEDKLTHAGSYGVGCMIETVENLLDININYYAKFNFKALVGLVDALGGIEVDVPFSFSESNSDDIPNTVHVTEGLQILDGEKALAYARHRSTQNDHVRNNSQQEVLKAILNKMVAFDTVTKINDLLDVLNTNMSTNLGRQEILDLITLVPRLGELQMSTMVIEGEDYETYVSKYDDYLWITKLTETSLQKAKEMIYGD